MILLRVDHLLLDKTVCPNIRSSHMQIKENPPARDENEIGK